MKGFSTLSKHIFIYIAICVISFILVSTICYKADYKHIYNYYSDRLYLQANEIANEYALDYLAESKLRRIELEMKSLSTFNDTRIMFITPSGDVILDTNNSSTDKSNEDRILFSINDFDYGDLKGKHDILWDFYGLFSDPELSVFSPISNSFEIKGYVVINIPESAIVERVYDTFNTNYLTLAIVLILSSAFLVLYFFQVHRPIKEITRATNEYSKGNLSYHVKPMHNDEIGRLGMSLDYMASQLNESDKFQQKFLSNISHDFRSPLTSIKGYLEAIQDGTIPPEMLDKYIGIMLFETERLTKLTSNILTLNELDPKSVRLDISTFDLNSIIRHTVETFEGTCKKKGIKFNITYANSVQNVKADKGRIQQVIYNLIDNAIKFSKENSYIYITVKEKGEKAQISIKDTGCGIAKEDIDKIWDRFYKSDSSRGRDKKGSGLGLSITKEVIQAHGENIDVVSTVGVGTEFIFTLELAK
ncbi:Alkaline phosphatase synthesis sensor protein phoR [Lachnospira eligens]|uniref:histidine kinase n=1 Tax=Lachnospira eligens TaxID=39485 RepID=A0A174YZ07_9FIRM|nr:ATP-binding protein [Lachnospira eligens]CUQ78942.1 Alkaline phosphatase synthesis sensor protein phoR [Lachnospira eligens]